MSLAEHITISKNSEKKKKRQTHKSKGWQAYNHHLLEEEELKENPNHEKVKA